MRRLAAAALACLALTACTGKEKPPKRIDGVEEFKDLSHTHVPWPVTYPQTPPVGGDHNPVWLKCGVYDETVPSVNAVHSMEHGAVWITYDPKVTGADLDAVHRLQAIKPSFVLISRFDGLPSPVVASAWGLQLRVDKADDPRLAEFVRTYAGGSQGGEKDVRCDNGATLDQARDYDERLASASPSPSS